MCGLISSLSLALTIGLPVGHSSGIDSFAERLILNSNSKVAAEPSFSIKQTLEQTAVRIVDGKAASLPMNTTQTSMIEIDMVSGTVRLTATEPNGRAIVAIRHGGRVALKLGSDPWRAPSGPYAAIADQLANPFACPLPKPGTDSPRWEVVGTDKLDGEVAVVVATIGTSAVKYAEGRIVESLAKAIPDAADRPRITVQSYVARHWIRKNDNRRLKAVQESRQTMDLPQPNGVPLRLDIRATTTATYSQYGKVKIPIPDEARRILDLK